MREFHFKLLAHTDCGDRSLANGWEAEGGKFLRQGKDPLSIKWRRADTCTNIVRDVVMTTANFPPIQVETTKSHVVFLARQLNIRSNAVNKKACYF